MVNDFILKFVGCCALSFVEISFKIIVSFFPALSISMANFCLPPSVIISAFKFSKVAKAFEVAAIGVFAF